MTMIQTLKKTLAEMDKKAKANGKRRQKGMTLVEIMVVITIIGLITAAVAVAVMPQLGKARTETAKADVKKLQGALDLYKMKRGSYPDTAAGWQAVMQSGELTEIPKDPWNEPYIYMLEGNKPVIMSYGADKQAGGQGEDEDVSNRSGATAGK